MFPEIKHIVYADDDEEDKELLREAFKKVCPAIQFTLAGDCIILLGILKKIQTPDFIILDINMPNLDGNECLKTIKSEKSLIHIPVIVYSTSSSTVDIEHSFQNGADYYIIKPNSIDALELLAKEICNRTLKSFTRERLIKKFL